MQILALKEDVSDDSEHTERDTFLYYFQLNKREWTAVALKADSVCRHLATVLKEGYSP